MNVSASSFILPGIFEFDYSPWTIIRSFSEIVLPVDKKIIVFCDIDDTLLHHPMINHRWLQVIREFYSYFVNESLSPPVFPTIDHYLDNLVRTRPFEHTDAEGFFQMVEKISKLVFISARPPSAAHFTRQNLSSIGVDPDKFETRLIWMSKKGDYINRMFHLKEYDSVIFIDDQPHNLENVYSAITHPGLEIYRFERRREDPQTYYPLPPGFPSNIKFNGNFVEEISPPPPPK